MGQLATVSNSSVTSGHIPSLDGWRALAIVMVIITHFRFLVRCKGLGRHGVGVFFVLSGYLITTVLMKEWEKNGHIDLRSYWQTGPASTVMLMRLGSSKNASGTCEPLWNG